jgi:hypothetical protein
MPQDAYPVQRRSPRERVQIAVTLVIEGEVEEHPATTVDLSAQGVRLQSDASIFPGQPVGLLLGTDPGYVLQARVVWIGKVGSVVEGQAGIEFLNPLARPVC